MAFIPYSCQEISQQDIEAVTEALRSPFVTQGPIVGEFERAFAKRHEVSHAVAVSSATAGLHIACLALDIGVGARVWTSPNSFLASANCALYCGAAVDFVDIDARTRNMSVHALETKLETAKQSGLLPQVVIPVDFSGLPCDLQRIRELADVYGFRIIEDASHATGATYLGRPVGSAFADLSVFSFHAVKVITTAEGGLVTTQDAALARRLRLLSSHGMTRVQAEMDRPSPAEWYYEQQMLGFNYRLTDVQAALGLSQLRRLDSMQARRQVLADAYDELLQGLPLVLPSRVADRRSAWHLYAVEIDEKKSNCARDEVFRHLRHAGIGANVHYIPIHTQPFYRRLGFRFGDFPVAERYASRTLSIPLFPGLTEEQQVFVASSLTEVLT